MKRNGDGNFYPLIQAHKLKEHQVHCAHEWGQPDDKDVMGRIGASHFSPFQEKLLKELRRGNELLDGVIREHEATRKLLKPIVKLIGKLKKRWAKYID